MGESPMTDQIPPPPPGFIPEGSATSEPAPPPGFQLEAAQPNPDHVKTLSQQFWQATANGDHAQQHALFKQIRAAGGHLLAPDEAGVQAIDQSAANANSGVASNLSHAALLTNQNVMHGVGDVAGLVWNPIAAGVNKAESAVGVDPGKYGLGDANQNIDWALQKAGYPQVQPQGAVENVGSQIERGATGAATGAGLAKGVAGVAGNPVVQHVAESLADAPGKQIGAAALGSGGSSTAHEMGAGPAGQIAAGLVGAASPAGMEASAQGIAGTAKRLMGPLSEEDRQLAQKAAQYGIDLSAPQVSNSKAAKLVDSVTGHVPFSGFGKFADTQQAQFNRAVGSTFGAKADKITPQVFAAAKNKLKGTFNRLTASNTLNITPDLVAKVRGLAAQAAAEGEDSTHTMLQHFISRMVGQSEDSQLPGRAYQSIYTRLGKIAKNGDEKGYYAGELRSALADAMDQSIRPEDQQAWRQARKQWANLKTVEPLVAKEGGASGNISPAQLMGRVTSDGAGKVRMAVGSGGDLGDLANIGQRFLKNTIQDSGTARRLAVLEALKKAGGWAGAGAAGAGAVMAPLQAALSAAGIVGTAKGAQRLFQSERLVNALINKARDPAAMRAAIEQSINPALEASHQAQHPSSASP